MVALEFDYTPVIGIAFMAFAIHMAVRIFWHIRNRDDSSRSLAKPILSLIVSLVPAWIGLDYLTWKAEINADGVAISRAGLPMGIQLPFMQRSHSIRWSDVSSVRFSPGYGGGRSHTPASLVITGAGETIDFPVNSIGRTAAKQVASILSACSPELSLLGSHADMAAAAETVSHPFGFDWGMRGSIWPMQGQGCSRAAPHPASLLPPAGNAER